jgi:hypothetical protein
MIYKLTYSNKETAIKDFIKKGVFVEVTDLNNEKQLVYGKGIQAIVEIGKVIKTQGVYDADFKEITAPIYAPGYAFDVMSDFEIDFGKNEIFPTTPMHNFAGCEPIKEVELLNNIIDEPTAI